MSLLFTPQQCFVIAIVAFGLIGFWRGWKREVISLAFALTGVLFLLLNGGNALAQLVFVKMPIVIHDIFSSGPAPAVSKPDSGQVLIVTIFERTPILQALQVQDNGEKSLLFSNQLNLFDL